MPRFESIIFYQNSPKIKLFLKKMQNFQALGALPPDPRRAFGGWGLRPQTPNSLRRLGALPPHSHTQPPIANFCRRTRQLCTVYNNYMRFCSFCLEQFFFDRSDANLMMLSSDVCLPLNRFLFESFICITLCVTLIPF